MFNLNYKACPEQIESQNGACLINEDLVVHFSNIALHFPIDSDDNYTKACSMLRLLNGSVEQMRIYKSMVEDLRDAMQERLRLYDRCN